MQDSANNERGAQAASPLPLFISQKKVRALKIARIEQAPHDQERRHAGGDWLLVPDLALFQPVCVGHDYVLKHKPEVGGYYVQYEDGYPSYSPAAAFEEGNTAVEQYGPPYHQEPKYGIGPRGRLMNRDTRNAIPDFEPVFILRAQDKLALQALEAYRNLSKSAGVDPGSIEERIAAFKAFEAQHPELMKYPNLWYPVTEESIGPRS